MERSAFSEDSPQFFKIFFPEECSEQLKIPPKFMKNFKNTEPFKSTLQTSDGRSWQVDVIKAGKYLYFENGWQEFVQYYALEKLDWLLFYYNDNAQFGVSVFGPNSHPKKLPTHKDNMEIEENILAPRTAVNSDNPSFEIVMKSTYIKGCYMTVPVRFWKKYMCKDKDTAKLNHSNKSWEVKVLRNLHSDRTNFTKGWPKFVADNHLRENLVCKFELISSDDYVFNVTMRESDCESKSTLRLKQLPERTDKAPAVNSDNPSFEKVLKSTNVNHAHMHVPVKFWEIIKIYMHEDRMVKLIHSNKCWEVKFQSHTQRFTAGWSKFAADNNLREGFICKFELISAIWASDYVFNVTVREPDSQN